MSNLIVYPLLFINCKLLLSEAESLSSLSKEPTVKPNFWNTASNEVKFAVQIWPPKQYLIRKNVGRLEMFFLVSLFLAVFDHTSFYTQFVPELKLEFHGWFPSFIFIRECNLICEK